MSNKDLAKQLVDLALSSILDRAARLVQDSALQKITITKEGVINTVLAVYHDLRNEDPARWPEIKDPKLISVGVKAFKRMKIELTNIPNVGDPKARTITRLVSNRSGDIIEFAQTRYHQPFFRKYKGIWISELNKVLKGASIKTLKETAESDLNEKDEISVGAFETARNSGTVEDFIVRAKEHRLHVDDSTIASLRTAAAINTLAGFMQWTSSELALGDLLSSISVAYGGISSTKSIVIGAAKGGAQQTLAHYSVNVKGIYDTDALRKHLVTWLSDMMDKKGIQNIVSAHEAPLATEYGRFLTKNVAVKIAGSKYTLKQVKQLSKKGSKKTIKPKRSKPHSLKLTAIQKYKAYITRRDAESGGKFTQNKALEIQNRLNWALKQGGGRAIIDNMGEASAPMPKALVNRTGRFARSVEINNVRFNKITKQISIRYNYMRNPYGTFEPGRAQGSESRDPHKLIGGTIRELAKNLMLKQGMKNLRLNSISLRRPVSG